MDVAHDHHFAIDSEQVLLSLEHIGRLSNDLEEGVLGEKTARILEILDQLGVRGVRGLARGRIDWENPHSLQRLVGEAGALGLGDDSVVLRVRHELIFEGDLLAV